MTALSQSANKCRIPMWLKVLYTAFLAVLVPYYWRNYGPQNFLYFCDIALFLTLIAVWTESALPASMAAVGIVAPQLLWLVDFAWEGITGQHLVRLSSYMYDDSIPLFVRGLSMFHGWLPLLLLWLVWRLGYDRRALKAQLITAWVVLGMTFLLVTDPHNPAGNVNKVFGMVDDGEVQTSLAPIAWLGLLMLAHPVLILIPSHVAFIRLFNPATIEDPARTPQPAE